MKMEKRQMILLIAAAAMVALWIGDKTLLVWWQARSQRIAVLRAQVKDGEALLKRETVIHGQWERMRGSTLPDNTALAEAQVLTALNGWARESGADLTGIMPQWKSDADDHKTLNCRVEAAGDLGTLSRFIYDIEKGPPGLKLDSVELTARDTGGQQLTMTLQVNGLALVAQKKP
jgi:Tfp pilus assembly protein PilO